MLNTACERDDLALIAVESVCRIEDPKFRVAKRSSMELILTCWSPVSRIRPFTSSRIATVVRSATGTDSGTRRSRSCSLYI